MLARPATICLVATLVLLGASAAGCESNRKIESNWTIEEANQFDEFLLYWLGESYEGLPLTAVTRYEPGTPTDAVVGDVIDFWYGKSTCNDSGCNAPLWIRIEPYCDGSDSSPAGVQSFLNGPLANAGYTISTVQVRGVQGYVVDIPRLHLWTGESAIQINSNDPSVSIERAARDLIPLAEDTNATPKPLPPPTSTEC